MTTNHQSVEQTEIPFEISREAAIARLQAEGNWPHPGPAMIEPDADYYVLAAFWGHWDALTSYLTGQEPGKPVMA